MCHWSSLCHFHPRSFLSVCHSLPSTGLILMMMVPMNDNDEVSGDKDGKNGDDDYNVISAG